MPLTANVVFLAMLFAIWVIRERGLPAAFLQAWIPVFVLLPIECKVDLPGVPDPNFMQAAILPILLVFFLQRGQEIRVGALEVLILAYATLRVGMEYVDRDYHEAQNYAFHVFTSMLGPYLLGRYLVDRREMDVRTARQFTLCLLVMLPMFLYEMRFSVTPMYTLLHPFFPDWRPELELRYGLVRTMGTFGHPILACLMIVVVYRLHRWLSWSGEWDRPQAGWLRWLDDQTRWMGIALRHKISIVLVAMAIMTISRGPWIGGFAGAALVAAGNFSNRRRWLGIALVLLALGAGGGKLALDAYTTSRIGGALSQEAKTMVYRKELVEKYQEFMLQKLWTGWGRYQRPKIQGMDSIDNAFLDMGLEHGVLAPALIVVIFLYALVTQLRLGLRSPPGEPPLGFTFAGIYLAAFVAFATVYMGNKTEPMLFLLLGWGENLKHRWAARRAAAPAERERPARAAPFRNVLY